MSATATKHNSSSSPKQNDGNKSARSTNSTKQQQQKGGEKQRENKKQQNEQSKTAGQESPQNTRRSPNKIYRTPPTPAPEELHTLERSFTLDCIAVNTTSTDYGKVRPKLGQVIPPYNAQKDKACEPYFGFIGVPKTLKRTGQAPPGASTEGPAIDRFFESGAGYQYLYLRNQHGAGHSRDTIDGHSQFMSGVQPIRGYNGLYGYRRTNPCLRTVPSPFGVATNSPIH